MTQDEALNILKLGLNVFLTGPAGSGKTYLLNEYVSYLENHGVDVAVTASTGIAATHLGGMTIHSWSGIGIKDAIDQHEIAKLQKKKKLQRRFENVKVLVIDEISMLHAHQLDMVDYILRTFRLSEEAFGGVQVIVSGDFFQLPPIAQNGQEAKFAYESEVWRRGAFTTCYLEEQHRQENDPLLSVLNDIRTSDAGEHTKVPLRTRYKKDPEGSVTPTKLYARNKNVDTINERALSDLEGVEEVFLMERKGLKALSEGLAKSCLAPEELRLKIGAEVMFVKNSMSGEYVNGTRGIVEDFDESEGWPWVRTMENDRVLAAPEEWRLEEDGVVRASITQVPLRLAWAITIHKSQGMTLDTAEIDLSDAFEPGMGYVALSRVRTLNGLKLMGLNGVALMVNKRVFSHDQELRRASEKAIETLNSFDEEERNGLQERVLLERFEGDKDGKTGKNVRRGAKKESTVAITRSMLEEGKNLQEIAEERQMTLGTIVGHIERMKEEGTLPDIFHIKPEEERFEIMKEALLRSEGMKLSPAKRELGDEYSFEDLKITRLFI